jgi:hypothetical protein
VSLCLTGSVMLVAGLTSMAVLLVAGLTSVAVLIAVGLTSVAVLVAVRLTTLAGLVTRLTMVSAAGVVAVLGPGGCAAIEAAGREHHATKHDPPHGGPDARSSSFCRAFQHC